MARGAGALTSRLGRLISSFGSPICPAPKGTEPSGREDVRHITINAKTLYIDVQDIYDSGWIVKDQGIDMITAAQMRAARALLAMDQRDLAARSGLSVPTIQRMEASEGVIRGNVDSLMKLISGLEAAGVELIAEGAVSSGGGRGVRLKG